MHVPSRPHSTPPIEQDEHVNVPTLMAARLPEITSLFGTLFSLIEHERELTNTQYIQNLEARRELAMDERDARARLHAELTGALARTPKKSRARRRKLARRLEGLEASTLTRGGDLALWCGREGHEPVVLGTEHVLGLANLHDADPLEFKGARVRHGKVSFRFTLDDTFHRALLELHVTQSIPHLFRGVPVLCGVLNGLAFAHSTTHDLPRGTCFYTRHSSDGSPLNPGLLLEQRGYARGDQSAGKLVRLQIEILKRITVSGEHGGHTFDEVPLVVEQQARHYEACDLPEGVRAGTWSTLTIPEELWALQREQFAQIPRQLLRSHDLYAVNLGLVLKSQEAYAAGREQVLNTGHALELDRLMNQAGLRQPFRAHTSRDRDLLATSLGALESMGLVTHITTQELERLESEPRPARANLPAAHAGPPAEQARTPRVLVRRRRRARRRHRSALQHRTVHIHLYQRYLPREISEPSSAAQGSLISSG